MKRYIISEQERQEILAKHTLAKMISEAKMETVKDLEKEIELLQKKIDDIKKKNQKKETNEDEFDDLLNADIDVEDERDSLEQS